MAHKDDAQEEADRATSDAMAAHRAAELAKRVANKGATTVHRLAPDAAGAIGFCACCQKHFSAIPPTDGILLADDVAGTVTCKGG